MARRSQFPQSSRCSRTAPRSVSLSDARILRALFAFAVVAGLCVAHASLRFKTLDLKVQHRQLQERTRRLSHEDQSLQRHTQVLAEDSRIRDAAFSSLKMRDIDSRGQMVASLPTRLVEKYSAPSSTERSGQTALAALPAPREERSLANALASFVDVSRAEAAVPQR